MRRRKILWTIPGLILAAVLFTAVFGARFRPGSYLGRCLLWGDSDTGDYLKFPAREVKNAPPAFRFKEDNTSFSMAKSFVSTLVGAAVDEGYIKSVNDPITDYLPELKHDPVLAAPPSGTCS